MTFSNYDRLVSLIVYFCVSILLFWAAMRFWMFVVPRVMQWRSYTSEKHKSELCEHTMTLADDAVIEITPFSEARNLWSGIYQVLDARDYFYIFIAENAAHIIPKRAFPDAESARCFYERAVSLHSAARRG